MGGDRVEVTLRVTHVVLRHCGFLYVHNISLKFQVDTGRFWVMWVNFRNYIFKAFVLLCVPPALTVKILRSAHRVHLCVFYEFQNKQQLFPHTALTDRFL
jgi:hypothetical protein